MLKCKSLTYEYRSRKGHGVTALKDIDFEACRGDVLGVVGSHGSGKSGLLRALSGRLSPSSGEVLLADQNVCTNANRCLVGYAAHPPVIPNEVTPVEWLSYLASHRTRVPAERVALVRWAIEFGGLQAFAMRRVAGFARGLAQRLAVAGAAMTGAALLVLDEVLSGLDIETVRELSARLASLASEGRIVVIASHDLAVLERLATRVLVLRSGRLVADESMAMFLRERVAELTLSGSGMTVADRLLNMFECAVRTGGGVDVPLRDQLSIEQVLATCRAERVAVSGSRIRYRRLEELLTEDRHPERPSAPLSRW